MLRRSKKTTVTAIDVSAQNKKAQEEEREAKEKEELQAKLKLTVERKDAGNITKLRGEEQNIVENLQSKTFTKWMNLVFAGSEQVDDLVSGIQKGETLCKLLSVLSGKIVGAGGAKVSSIGNAQFQSLAGQELAFRFMKEEGLNLVGIGPQDVIKGNRKLILGLVWSLILHYHLPRVLVDGDGTGSRIRGRGREDMSSSLLGWVREKLRGYDVRVADFRGSLKDGRVLCCLVDSLKPGVINVASLDPKKELDNRRLAIQKAEEFGIPALIEPEGFDELSAMLYISYFKQRDKDVKQGRPLEREQVAVKEREVVAPVDVKVPTVEKVEKEGKKDKVDVEIVKEEPASSVQQQEHHDVKEDSQVVVQETTTLSVHTKEVKEVGKPQGNSSEVEPDWSPAQPHPEKPKASPPAVRAVDAEPKVEAQVVVEQQKIEKPKISNPEPTPSPSTTATAVEQKDEGKGGKKKGKGKEPKKVKDKGKKKDKEAKKREKEERKKKKEEKKSKKLGKKKGKTPKEDKNAKPAQRSAVKDIGTLLDEPSGPPKPAPVQQKEPEKKQEPQSVPSLRNSQQQPQPQQPQQPQQHPPSPPQPPSSPNSPLVGGLAISDGSGISYGSGGLDSPVPEFKPIIFDAGDWEKEEKEKEKASLKKSTLNAIFSQVSADDDEKDIDAELQRLMELRKAAEKAQTEGSPPSPSMTRSLTPLGGGASVAGSPTKIVVAAPPSDEPPQPKPAPAKLPKHSRLIMKNAADENLAYIGGGDPTKKPRLKPMQLAEIPSFRGN